MKIIDLYVMVSKGEQPKKFKYRDEWWAYSVDACDFRTLKQEYRDADMPTYEYLMSIIDTSNLNDEVEIIEEVEEDEFEDIETLNGFNITKESFDDTELGLKLGYTGVSETFNKVYFKINELVKAVNELKNKD